MGCASSSAAAASPASAGAAGAAEGVGHENADEDDAAGFASSDFDKLPKPKPTGFPPKPPLPPPNAKPLFDAPTPNRDADGGGCLSAFSVDEEAETLPPNSGAALVVFSGEVVTPNRGVDEEALSPPLKEPVEPNGLTKGLSSAWNPSLVAGFELPESPNSLLPPVLDPKRLLPKTEDVEEEPNAEPVKEDVDDVDSAGLLELDEPEVLLAGGGKEKTDFAEEPVSVDLLESNLKPPPPLEEVVEVDAAGGPNPENVAGGAGIAGGGFTTAVDDEAGGMAKKELLDVADPLVELLGLVSAAGVGLDFFS